MAGGIDAEKESGAVKHCPTCGSTYTDDTLVYCLQDGAMLQAAGEATNPLNLVVTLRDDVQGHEAKAPTGGMNASSAPTIEIPASALPTAVYQEPRLTARATSGDASSTPQPRSSTRVMTITVVVTVLLLAAGGFGAWRLFRGHGDGGGRERRAAEANTSNASSSYNQTRGDNRPDNGGRWFVILGSFTKEEAGRANERLEMVRRQGFDARIVSSDDYPNLKSGLLLIVMGPYNRNNAEEVLGQVRPKVKEAYTKSGW